MNLEKSDSGENKMNGFRLEFNDATGVLTLHELTIKNKEVIEYIRNSPETKQEETIKEILEFGVKSLKSFLTENYGSLIDIHFKQGFSDLDSKLSQKVGEIDKIVLQGFINDANEKIVRGFSKEFDDKKDSLTKLLNENKDKLSKEVLKSFLDELKDGVFTTFKKDFTEISTDLKQSLLKYVTEEKGKEKTPLKGRDFENYVVELSQTLAKAFGDTISHVGGDNKTGDVMVENSSDKLRFCIEVKDSSLTDPKIKETFEEMEKTRKVQHSIIVFRNSNEVPKIVGTFHLFGRNRLVLAVAGSSDEGPNPFLFNVGYRLMRSLTLTEKASVKGIDTGDITKRIHDIGITLTKFSSLKGKVTSFSNDLTSDLEDLKGEIVKGLNEVEEILEDER
jgi:hypothetical protein